MKKFIKGIIFFLLLFPVSGFAKEASEISSEAVAPVEPSLIPPATSFTPKQSKPFLSMSHPKEENYIIFNFDNAALRDVINAISSITGENFILSPGLDARITIYSAGKIPRSEVLSVFESVLEVNNMSLVRVGSFYKIVPATTIKQKPIEVQKGKKAEDVPSEDKPVTQIVPVEYVPVGELSLILQPMLSPFGSLVPNPRNNMLIVNDIASNIKRLLTVLKEIDVSAFQNTRMGFFQPKYSDAKTIAEELTAIINALNLGREGTVTMVPIERINGLVVFSSSPSLLQIVDGWFKKLDEEIISGQNIFVYPVQNVDAERIANILKTIYETGETTTTKPKTMTTIPSKGETQRPPQVSAPRQAETKIEIVVFEPTNSLVIRAPPGIYREMVETIKKLDVYPQEVLIEVVIAEVTLEGTDQFGIQWSILHNLSVEGKGFEGHTAVIGKGTTDNPAPSLGKPTWTTGIPGFSYTLFRPDKLIAMLHALASKGKVNILSSPRLLVKNQKEASLEVGENRPTATSTTTAAAATTAATTLTQNIEYKTVGIKLKIKPSINDEKTVVLDIEQEVSDVLLNVTVGAQGFTYPAFSIRKAKTSVVVPNKQGIVIGGIIKEKNDKTYQGIPLLSSIPILGNLFRYTVDTKKKTELVVLLTPHVVTNKTEADVLTSQFIDKLKEVKDYLKKTESQINIPILEENKSSQSQ